jgi:mannose-6-phosphate isomerase-like protein (cupin superfamily)
MMKPSAQLPNVTIVGRDDIPALTSVVVDGVEHSLGILKDFRRHRHVAAFLPEDARLSLSWVRLEVGEKLEIHVHSVDSMIVVGHGNGMVLGDLEAPFSDGDIILIPRGRRHGFEGAGSDGFWALSTQFEDRGLYERPNEPLVKFESENGLVELLSRNRRYCEEHRANPIFNFVTSERIADPERRRRFLSCVQVWSNYFQKAVMGRTVFTDHPGYAALFRRHLDDEYGHDTGLAKDRGPEASTVWDPVLEGISSWFITKMLSLDNLEKLVLVHLVLEDAGSTFHGVAGPAMAQFGETSYFALHSKDDDAHVRMALQALEGQEKSTYDHLMEIQRQGWDMLNTLCARMVEVADGETE